MNQLRSFILPLLFLFTACEKVIEPGELPEQDQRLVLNAPIYNDSIFSAKISLSKSIISGKDYKQIEGAYCAIFEDGVFLEQLLSKGKGFYLGTKKPSPNKKYKIVARYTGYNDVEGETQMPSQPLISKFQRIDTLNNSVWLSSFQNGNRPDYLSAQIRLKLFVNDKPGIKNFYLVRTSLVLYDTTGERVPHSAFMYTYSSNNIEAGSFYYSDGILLNDEAVSADNEVTVDFTSSSSLSLADLPTIDSISINIQVAELSSDFYYYLQTVTKQTSQGASFFAEPTLIYNNITNGMGIVGGMSAGSPIVVYRRHL